MSQKIQPEHVRAFHFKFRNAVKQADRLRAALVVFDQPTDRVSEAAILLIKEMKDFERNHGITHRGGTN